MAVEDPDDGWAAAAEADDVLVAYEIFFLSRPQERRPWQELRTGGDPLPPPAAAAAVKWGCRRTRSRSDAARESDKGGGFSASTSRSSPTTPLSWNAGSPSSAEKAVGEQHRSFFPSDGSIKAEGDADATTSKAVVVSAPRKTHGKRKMTLPELRELEKHHLEAKARLDQELKKERMMRDMLMEQNKKLRKLLLDFQPVVLAKPVAPLNDKPQRKSILSFDLNEPLFHDLDIGPD